MHTFGHQPILWHLASLSKACVLMQRSESSSMTAGTASGNEEHYKPGGYYIFPRVTQQPFPKMAFTDHLQTHIISPHFHYLSIGVKLIPLFSLSLRSHSPPSEHLSAGRLVFHLLRCHRTTPQEGLCMCFIPTPPSPLPPPPH